MNNVRQGWATLVCPRARSNAHVLMAGRPSACYSITDKRR